MRILHPVGVANHSGELGKRLQLRDDVDIRVRIGLPPFALDDPARMATARRVPRARNRVAEFPVRILRVLLERTVLEPLLIAQLDATEVQHRVLHRAGDALTAARLFTLEQRGEDAGHEMDAGARVADLRACHERHAVDFAGR